MDDGLGLMVTTRPHGKTAAQLLQQMFATKSRWHGLWPELWELAAQNGHVSLLEWLHHNSPTLPENEWHSIGRLAAHHGQVAALKWMAHSPKYVFTALRMRAWVLVVKARAVMPLCTCIYLYLFACECISACLCADWGLCYIILLLMLFCFPQKHSCPIHFRNVHRRGRSSRCAQVPAYGATVRVDTR